MDSMIDQNYIIKVGKNSTWYILYFNTIVSPSGHVGITKGWYNTATEGPSTATAAAVALKQVSNNNGVLIRTNPSVVYMFNIF